jgi:hypothetical protein
LLGGDDLTIVLFFVGTAVSFACAAMSAAGWKHPALIVTLFALAAACFIFGAGWPAFKEISPPSWIAPIHQVATSPVAWFAVLVLGMTASILLPKRRASSRPPTQNKLVVRHPDILPATVSAPETKTVINVTPKYLVDLYQDRTSIQADALAAMYMGKWMSATGKVSNVWKRRGGYRVIILDETNTIVTFNFGEKPEVAYLTSGAVITGRGKIDQIGRLGLDLEECELVA